MDGFIGEIRVFPWNWAPAGWLACNGQSLPIQSYAALYSVIGIAYGGNGQTTFQLPNLQGTAVMGGAVASAIGAFEGSETATVPIPPAHNHTASVILEGGDAGATAAPAANISLPTRVYTGANNAAGTPLVAPSFTTTAPTTSLNAATVSSTGKGLPHENRQPYLAMQFCICVQDGAYPVHS